MSVSASRHSVRRVVTSAPTVAAATSEVLRLASVDVVAPVLLVESLVAPIVALVVELLEGSVEEAMVLLFSLVLEVVGSAGDVVLVELDVEPVAATEPVADVVD